jgi:3-oxoacyl-[acyl-carrier protein] reductase
MKLRDRVAIVTGASRGMGREIALALAREGADLVLAARTLTDDQVVLETRPGSISAVAEEVEGIGRRALAVRTDVSVSADVDNLVATTLSEFGRLDILVNSAWSVVFRSDPLDDLMRSEVSDATIGTFKGIVDLTRAVLPHMREAGFGRIINITSVGGKIKVPNAPVYAGLKAGVAHFSRSVSEVVARDGVTVNCVAPGIIDTPSTFDSYGDFIDLIRAGIPVGRLGREDEVARVVVFLAEEDSGYLSGVTLSVDGGLAHH